MRALASKGSLFTSGLSVNEFALLNRLGPQPLAQVMGASVVRTGWQYLPPLEPGHDVHQHLAVCPTPTGVALQNRYTEASLSQVRNYQWRTEVVCELDVLTDAWNLARRRALNRLREEALQVGADAVVGVHLRRSDHDLGKRTIEYLVTGTAIRLPRLGRLRLTYPQRRIGAELLAAASRRPRAVGIGGHERDRVRLAAADHAHASAEDDRTEPGARGTQPRVPAGA